MDKRDKSLKNSKNLDSNILKSLKFFKEEVKGLYLPTEVPVIHEFPDSFDFYRNWVAPNIPVLIKGGIKNWGAIKKWNKDYFCNVLKDKKVSVAVTPNGYADAIKETIIDGKRIELFVLPEERQISISEFYENLEGFSKGKKTSVFYIQKQNSNLLEEFPELLTDIDKEFLWASECFQSKPVAINLWIGDQRAVTSLHKDPMENIYCVISGEKEFILLPPTDRPWLPYKKLSVGQYQETSPGVFDIHLFKSDEWKYKTMDTVPSGSDESFHKVPWIAIDPTCPDNEKYPLYKNASPIKVVVKKGDAFYLPSLWFHHVKQTHNCVAVNYWYDMNFDVKYAYFQLIEKLSKCLGYDE